jgi:6-phosphofructokinase 1
MADHVGSGTILVIDNDESFGVSLTRDVLAPEGFNVEYVTNLSDADAFLRTHLVHLAIVDLRLKHDDDPNDHSGLDFCRKLEPLVARIILTGFPDYWRLVREALLPVPQRHRLADGFIYKSDENMQRDLLPEIQRVLTEEFEIIPQKRIGVLTSGGDSPGMNAALRAIVRTAMNNDMEVLGVQDGYQGLVNDLAYKMKWNQVSDILIQGGTILGTARFDDFKDPAIRDKAVQNILRKQVSGLIVIGGDGSMQGATALAGDLAELGVPLQTVAIPGTIDNDLWGTDMSLGAASASNAIADILRNMIKPAQALRRIFVCEVMGRYSGYLALQAAIDIGADAVLIPEKIVQVRSPSRSPAVVSLKERIDKNRTEDSFREGLAKVAKTLEAAFATGKRYGFVILAEGIGQLTKDRLNGRYVREFIENCVQDWDSSIRPDVRDHVLGHPVRGVPPSRFDVWLGSELGAAAVQCILQGKTEVMVGWSEEKGIIDTPFREVIAKSNLPPKDKWQDRPKWQQLLELQQATACPPSLREQLRESGNRSVIPS